MFANYLGDDKLKPLLEDGAAVMWAAYSMDEFKVWREQGTGRRDEAGTEERGDGKREEGERGKERREREEKRGGRKEKRGGREEKRRERGKRGGREEKRGGIEEKRGGRGKREFVFIYLFCTGNFRRYTAIQLLL